jgi:hypothetical protein
VIAESSFVFRRSQDEAGKDDEAGNPLGLSMQSRAASRCRSQHETKKTFGNRSNAAGRKPHFWNRRPVIFDIQFTCFPT